jgi:allantoicase
MRESDDWEAQRFSQPGDTLDAGKRRRVFRDGRRVPMSTGWESRKTRSIGFDDLGF